MLHELNKILYAEDEPDIRSIAQIALEDLGGFSVEYCNDGKDIIAIAMKFKPDLFLLDVMMPGKDGLAVLRELRQVPLFANTPAVFMTAKIQPNEIAEYKMMGVLDVIVKPFDPMTLAKTLRTIWKKYAEAA